MLSRILGEAGGRAGFPIVMARSDTENGDVQALVGCLRVVKRGGTFEIKQSKRLFIRRALER